MEILYLIITLLIGGLIGYFIASRQLNSLKTQLYLQTKHHEDLLEAEKKQHATETERYREENLRIQNQAENNIKLVVEANRQVAVLQAEKRALEEKLDHQKQEIANLHKQFNLEFENIANKIFQQKAESFNKLSAESLSNLLNPFRENLNEFKHQVAEVYDKESKQRFSLEDKIKELVQLNKQISDEANNLTRALKGDSKTQGNWGEMILESILENSGLREGEEYFRQEFLKDEHGEP